MTKYFIWGLVLLYWIWPIDLAPGNPIDDILLVALAWHRDEITSYLKGAVKWD